MNEDILSAPTLSISSFRKSLFNPQHVNSSSKEIINIVFVGDSHMRYLFAAASLRLASPLLRFRNRKDMVTTAEKC